MSCGDEGVSIVTKRRDEAHVGVKKALETSEVKPTHSSPLLSLLAPRVTQARHIGYRRTSTRVVEAV